MKILTVVGKVDSRPIIYPLARALSLNGLTGIITDDGAYRRLYHGKGNLGTVSGVDVSICSHVDEKTVHSLDDSGVPYDNLIIVSTDYIHPDSTGLVICHGLDKSMMAKPVEEDDDDFLLPLKTMTEEAEQAKSENSEDEKDNKKPKKEDKSEDSDNVNSTEEVKEEPKEETIQEKRMRMQEENPDIIVVPDNMEFSEVQIAYAAAPKKSNIIGVSLKEGLISYCYKCEEQKQFDLLSDRALIGTLVKIFAKPLQIELNELSILLNKEEGAGGLSKGKKK